MFDETYIKDNVREFRKSQNRRDIRVLDGVRLINDSGTLYKVTKVTHWGVWLQYTNSIESFYVNDTDILGVYK